MTGNALGFIETIGLTAAIEAADTAVKSANVRLLGYELAKGDGMTTVKIEGDVGAVKSAVKAAEAAVAKIGRIVSVHVIPRPAKGTEQITLSRETVGLNQADKTVIHNVPKSARVPPEAQMAGEFKDRKKPRSQPRKSKVEGGLKAQSRAEGEGLAFELENTK